MLVPTIKKPIFQQNEVIKYSLYPKNTQNWYKLNISLHILQQNANIAHICSFY